MTGCLYIAVEVENFFWLVGPQGLKDNVVTRTPNKQVLVTWTPKQFSQISERN